jgi:hypothetical protein
MRALLIGLLLCLTLATNSHAATPTPAAESLTYDEGVYIGRVLMTLNLFGASARRYSDLSSAPDPFDTAWVAAIGAEPRMWEALFDEFSAVDPPLRFATLHDDLTDALEQMALTADDCINGIEHLDASAVEDCNAGIRHATVLLNAVDLSIVLAA